jgi:hypothetical protein
MCDHNYQKLNQEYQQLLLKQIRILANEIKAWRMTSSSSHRTSLEEFMRSTDLSGWQYSLERGPLQFPNVIKRWWHKLFG